MKVMHWIWAASTSLGFLNLAKKTKGCKGVKGRPSTTALTFGREKFLQIRKLTYTTYLHLINFLFELIPKSKPI